MANILHVVRRLARSRRPSVPVSEVPLASNGMSGPVRAQTAQVLLQLKEARLGLMARASPAMDLAPTIRAIRRTEARLGRPLCVAIVGEFNAGKSSLANLLVSIESLPTAAVQTTRIPTLLYQARKAQVWGLRADGTRQLLRAGRAQLTESLVRLEVGLPSARLRGVQFLDLPGFADARSNMSPLDLPLNAVDAVLWCTVSTQAWKESERKAWEQFPARLRARGLLVTTHCDLLRSGADRERLLSRLRLEAGPMFNGIALISNSEALAAVRGEHGGSAAEIWEASGAQALDTLLDELLTTVRKHRNKAALTMICRIADHTLARLSLLEHRLKRSLTA
jgi:hypothetical protein